MSPAPRILPLVLLVGSCASPASPESTAKPAPAAAVDPEFMPTPFTAEQIRTATPAGRALVFKSWSLEAGESVSRMEFTEVDAEGATFVSSKTQANGEVGAPSSKHETWIAFQEHARFPIQGTTKTRQSVTVPAGTFEATRYTVVQPKGGVVMDYWFSPDHPGPPVKMQISKDDKLTFRMELLEHSVP